MREQRLYVRLLRWITTSLNFKTKGIAMGHQELTFVATKDLMEELARRHDALVILGMRFTSKDGYNITRFHRGHRYVCLGMLSNAETLINAAENDSLKYAKEDNV